MKKRKCVSAALAFSLIFITLFTGCGDGRGAGDADGGTTAESTVVTVPCTTEPQTEAETEGMTAEAVNFFDGAVFVGDSVTMGLRNFVTSERNKGNECLGDAVFLTAGSMSYANTLRKIGGEDAIHPRFGGKEMYIEDALALIEAKKVFIMLGMNDFCIYTAEEAMGNVKKCINRIKEKNPGIDIYIESVTPVDRDRGSFSNENIDKFNAAMKAFCRENGCTYVDVASVMKNPDGTFIESYCSDPDANGVHMTFEGCAAWVDYLNKKFGTER